MIYTDRLSKYLICMQYTFEMIFYDHVYTPSPKTPKQKTNKKQANKDQNKTTQNKTKQKTQHQKSSNCGVRVVQSLVSYVMFCRLLFDLLSMFSGPLHCLFSLDLRLLINYSLMFIYILSYKCIKMH